MASMPMPPGPGAPQGPGMGVYVPLTPADLLEHWLVPASVVGLALLAAVLVGLVWRGRDGGRVRLLRPGPWRIGASSAGISAVLLAPGAVSAPFPSVCLVLAVLLGSWYVAAARQISHQQGRWPVSRTVAFLLGVSLGWLAVGSSVGYLAGQDFVMHVLQHLTLMIFSPILLALAAPTTLALRTSPRRVRRGIVATLRSRVMRIAHFPVVSFFGYYGVMIWFFTTSAVVDAMMHPALMAFFNVAFLVSGALYWWPLVGLDPVPHWRFPYWGKVLSLFLGAPFEAFLGVAVMMAKSLPVIGLYGAGQVLVGGGVLWASSEMTNALGLGAIVWQWNRSETRAARRIDRQLDAAQDRVDRARAAGRPVPDTGRVLPGETAVDGLAAGMVRPWCPMPGRVDQM